MELGILTTRHRTLHSTPVTSSDISKAVSLEISVERKQGHHRVQTWEKSANDITPEGRDNMGAREMTQRLLWRNAHAEECGPVLRTHVTAARKSNSMGSHASGFGHL